MKATSATLAAAIVFLASQNAFAHPADMLTTGGIAAGLLHPLLGLDHSLAMLALSLFSAQLGGRAIWALPSSFLAGVVAGGIAGLSGALLPGIELAIAASLLVLGATIALNQKMNHAAPVVVAGLFGLFHGHAHAAEASVTANPTFYVVGFAISTCALQLAGLAIGVKAAQFQTGAVAIRLAGATIAVVGVLLLLAAQA